MIPVWPNIEFDVSRQAIVEDDEGRSVNLFQCLAAAVRGRSRHPRTDKVMVGIQVFKSFSADLSDDSLIEAAHRPIAKVLRKLVDT